MTMLVPPGRRGSPASAAIIPIIALAVLACDDRPQPSGPEVRDSAGVAIVVHPRGSLNAATPWSVDAEPVLILGGSANDEAGQFHRISSALRVEGGIVVADAGSGEIRWFDSAGAHLATAGGEGEGPGEFRDLSWIGRAPDGGILAWDRRLRRVSVFLAGEFLRDAAPPLPDDAPYPAVHGALADGTLLATPGPVYVPREAPGVQRPSMPVWLISGDGAVLDTLGTFAGTAVDLRPARGPGWIRTEVPFGPTTMVAAGSGEIVVGDNARYELRHFGRSGELMRVVRVHVDQGVVTEEDVERELARRLANVPPVEDLRAGIRASYRRTPPAEVMPAFEEIVVDRTDHVWVRRAGPGDGAGAATTWDVIDPSGTLIGAVRIPAGLRITDIGVDYVLGVVTDDLGVETVRLHRQMTPRP